MGGLDDDDDVMSKNGGTIILSDSSSRTSSSSTSNIKLPKSSRKRRLVFFFVLFTFVFLRTLQQTAEDMLIFPQDPVDSKTEEMEEIEDFQHIDGVVIAVKIHGGDITELKQSLCLLQAAYNSRMNYDHLVFSSLPIPENAQQELVDLVSPARIQFASDTKPLPEALANMTDSQKQVLSKRCKVDSVENITWSTRCDEDGAPGTTAIQYNWQAEFRSKHIWTHPALQPYRYMLWFDSDSMPTQVWEHDPIAIMKRNNLVMLFDNLMGNSNMRREVQDRVEQAFDVEDFCSVNIQDGHLVADTVQEGKVCKYRTIHGFFHVTDLDFYRSPAALKWFNIMIGDSKYSRKWDDQLAVTMPAAILAPNRSWDMYSHNVKLRVMHNGWYDGKIKADAFYKKFWQNQTNFPEARATCSAHVKVAGR